MSNKPIPQELADDVIVKAISRFPKRLRPKLRMACADAFTHYAARNLRNMRELDCSSAIIYPISSGGAMYTAHPYWEVVGSNLVLSLSVEAGRTTAAAPLEQDAPVCAAAS